MARAKRKLKISYRETASNALLQIWLWNAERDGASRADGYVRLLRKETVRIASLPAILKKVDADSTYSYAQIIRKGAKHGHVVVVAMDENSIDVVDYLHTAQDWREHVRRRHP